MKTASLLRLSAAAALLSCAASAYAASCCCKDEPAATAASAEPADNSLYQAGLTFQDENGKPVALASLKGRPVVVAMFFASCSYACPALVGELQHLQAGLPEGQRARTAFVLVSFDPDRDQPSVLADYRRLHNLDSRWTLLRGSARSVRELAALLGVSYKRMADGSFSHNNVVTILDASGVVAGRRLGLGTDVSGLLAALASPEGEAAHPAS